MYFFMILTPSLDSRAAVLPAATFMVSPGTPGGYREKD
jgi:hypothetical protein